jgi:hypothetical protein
MKLIHFLTTEKILQGGKKHEKLHLTYFEKIKVQHQNINMNVFEYHQAMLTTKLVIGVTSQICCSAFFSF